MTLTIYLQPGRLVPGMESVPMRSMIIMVHWLQNQTLISYLLILLTTVVLIFLPIVDLKVERQNGRATLVTILLLLLPVMECITQMRHSLHMMEINPSRCGVFTGMVHQTTVFFILGKVMRYLKQVPPLIFQLILCPITLILLDKVIAMVC